MTCHRVCCVSRQTDPLDVSSIRSVTLFTPHGSKNLIITRMCCYAKPSIRVITIDFHVNKNKTHISGGNKTTFRGQAAENAHHICWEWNYFHAKLKIVCFLTRYNFPFFLLRCFWRHVAQRWCNMNQPPLERRNSTPVIIASTFCLSMLPYTFRYNCSDTLITSFALFVTSPCLRS